METFSRGTVDPWYVTGFVDAEGTFTFSRSGRAINLYFAIKLTEQDRPVVEAIQQFFGGVGRIYELAPRSGSGRAASYYRVSRVAELARIVEHFDRYRLLGQKALSYEVWREMYEHKRVLRKAPHGELAELAVRLSESSIRHPSQRARRRRPA